MNFYYKYKIRNVDDNDGDDQPANKVSNASLAWPFIWFLDSQPANRLTMIFVDKQLIYHFEVYDITLSYRPWRKVVIVFSLLFKAIDKSIVIVKSSFVRNKITSNSQAINVFLLIAKVTIFNWFTDIFIYLLTNLIKLLIKAFKNWQFLLITDPTLFIANWSIPSNNWPKIFIS